MLKIIVSIFLILHGLVHLLYFGQSARFFELKPGLVWPAGSWAFSKLPGDNAIRLIASISCILAAIGFITAGIGIFFQQDWRHWCVLGSAVFSSLLFILFWDGTLQKLHDQGWIAILINGAILVSVLKFHWPYFQF